MFKTTVNLAVVLAFALSVSRLAYSGVYANNDGLALTQLEANCGGKGKHKHSKPHTHMADEEEGTPDPDATFPTD